MITCMAVIRMVSITVVLLMKAAKVTIEIEVIKVVSSCI